MRSTPTRRFTIAAVAAASLALAACGSSSKSASSATTVAPATTAAATTTAAPATTAAATTAAPATTAPAASGPAAVQIATTKLGQVVADGKGMTLYMFGKDTANTSVCVDKCASAWPPLVTVGAPTLGTGLDAADFGTFARADGTKQVTFYGHPLYYFAGDKAAGDVNGQNVGQVWFALTSAGAAVKS